MFQIANYTEAGLWLVIAAVLIAGAVRRGGSARRRAAVAGAVFIIFGMSDVMEARTGAWWRPWWLLALKAGCIAALLILLWNHTKAKRNSSRSN